MFGGHIPEEPAPALGGGNFGGKLNPEKMIAPSRTAP